MTGCQVSVGGQTLPSPYYLYDDVQYFAPGPEFKLSNESPVGKAIIGRKKGEVVEVAAPRGSLKYKIIEIKAA